MLDFNISRKIFRKVEISQIPRFIGKGKKYRPLFGKVSQLLSWPVAHNSWLSIWTIWGTCLNYMFLCDSSSWDSGGGMSQESVCCIFPLITVTVSQFVLQLIGNNVFIEQVIMPCGFAQKFYWYVITIIYAQPVVMGRPHNFQERELCSFQIRGCSCIYLIELHTHCWEKTH